MTDAILRSVIPTEVGIFEVDVIPTDVGIFETGVIPTDVGILLRPRLLTNGTLPWASG